MKASREERESDVRIATLAVTHAAEQWLDARSSSNEKRWTEVDENLAVAIETMRAAERRLVKTYKRLAKQAR